MSTQSRNNVVEVTAPDGTTNYLSHIQRGTCSEGIWLAAKFTPEEIGSIVEAFSEHPANAGWTFRAIPVGAGGPMTNGGWRVLA